MGKVKVNTMHIEHVAIWTTNLERLVNFYQTFFGASAGPKYVNERKQFESYFLSFSSGARIEIMSTPYATNPESSQRQSGYAHIAISTGSRERVESITHQIAQAGYQVISGPRTTGDGYYESVVLDPDGNRVEITI
jgi:lactoylglutathione lyase